jgi:hypothetical protein
MLVHYYYNNNTTLGAPLATSTVYLTFFMGANQDKNSANYLDNAEAGAYSYILSLYLKHQRKCFKPFFHQGVKLYLL